MKYPIPAVSVAVVNPSGDILLWKSETEWRLPGGRLPGGLDWVATARSFLAELGLRSREERLYGIYSNPRFCVSQGEQIVTAAFLVTAFEWDKGEINRSDGKLDWVPPHGLTDAKISVSERVRITDALAFQGEVFLR